MPVYLTTADVAVRMDVSVRTVRRWMRTTEAAGLTRPWVTVGNTTRWNDAEISAWLKELEEWQTSRTALTVESPTSSDGTTSTGLGALAQSQPSATRAGSRRKSKPAKGLESTGSLRDFAESLVSTKPAGSS
tara:strand:+ start:194 stop:589 length:396 start_codon:yes stop_codon:yes gene_type:complete